MQRFLHKRCVKLPAGLTAPCSLRSLGNARIRPLRELYFAGSMYALSFMKFTKVILNRGALFGTAAALVRSVFGLAQQKLVKAGSGIYRTAREVEPLLTSLRARLPAGFTAIAAGNA